MNRNFIYTLMLLLGCSGLFAQSFQDNFTDGDFTNNPTWSGDQLLYIVNASNELQINDLGNSASASLYVPVAIQDSTTWEFLIKTNLTTSGPSSSNRIRIYLQSDNADYTNNVNGYFLEIGETGSNDALDLHRVSNGSATSILRGTDGQVAGATNNVRVRIVRDNLGNWEMFADYTGGTTFVSEGTATDATHTGGSFFIVQNTYSSTQGDNVSFNDFLISPLFVDVVAPSLVSATAISATEIDLLFDEALDPTTANNSANYSIDNGITVTNAQLDGTNSALVHLTGTNLTNQTTYQATANNIEDLAGNAMGSQNASFSYVVIIPAAFQDVIFNEIMIDPNPVVNLPDAEYIELYNRSNQAVDLTNYELTHRSASSGAETNRTLGAYTLLPGEYVILHNDAAYTTAANNLQIPSFPSLNNTSAYLILRDAGGLMIDSILYDNDWYQDNNKDDGGWAIELINPNLVCKGGDNWIASNDVNGGTPGSVNSVLDNSVDTTAPVIVEARQADVNIAVLTFDDILDPVNATNTANYTVSGGLSVVFAQMLDQYSVELTFNINMTADDAYTITVSNVGDCVGNIATRTASFTYYEVVDATHYDVLINEIFADANPVVGLPEKEFVELYNRSNKDINLEGYEFSDGTSNISIFPFYILRPGEYLIIYEEGDGISYSSFGNVIEFSTFPDLDVGSDDLVLTDSYGDVIDAVSYSNTWYGDGDKSDGGWSLERINPNRPCEGRENWRASNAQPPSYTVIGGSPGVANSILQIDTDQQSPDVIRAYPFGAEVNSNSDSIRLYFSEAMGDSTGVNVANYVIDNGVSVIEAYLEPPFYNTIVILTDNGLTAGTIYTLTMTNGLTDCVGNSIALNNEVQFALPETIEAGDLILNEILFNPVTGGDDYLELYNNSDKVLSLMDVWVANTQADTLLLDDANAVYAEYLIFPQSYVVIASEPEEVEATYRTTDPEKTPDLNKMVEFNLPTYSDEEGTAIIYTVNGNSQATIVEVFTYSEDYQSSLIDDLNGVALERVDFNAVTNEGSNWHSAAQPTKFGTPTYRNSANLSNEITEDGLIQLPNEVFSPDGDGFEDFLLINYNIDASGYVANIAIYDAQGRFVRQLVNNELLMAEGTLQWDGSTENGEKALIGLYIIMAEIFDPNGNAKRYKKTCVVAGQLD